MTDLVEVDVGELHAGDRLEADHPFGLEVVAVELHRQVGAIERRPGLGLKALQQHAPVARQHEVLQIDN